MSILNTLTSIKFDSPTLEVEFTSVPELSEQHNFLRQKKTIFAKFVYTQFGLKIDPETLDLNLEQVKFSLSTSISKLNIEIQELFEIVNAELDMQFSPSLQSDVQIWMIGNSAAIKIQKIATLIHAFERFETELRILSGDLLLGMGVRTLEELIFNSKFNKTKNNNFNYLLGLYNDLFYCEDSKMVIDQMSVLNSFREDEVVFALEVPTNVRIKLAKPAQTSKTETIGTGGVRLGLKVALIAAAVLAASQIKDCNNESSEQSSISNAQNSN